MFARYVAIGDSQTEGLNDHDGDGGFIGWADRLAGHLAAANPAVQYANLAVRGRVTRQIHDQQLAPALALKPDLITVVAGVNDLRRRHTPIAEVLELIDAMYVALVASGAHVVTCNYPDISAMIPFGRRMTARLAELNDGIRRAAHRRDVTFIDFEGNAVATDPRLWSDDRIHLNADGHRVLATAFADALGLPDTAHWKDPLPPLPPSPRLRRVADDTRWIATHLAPALVRHARGRSSGDGISPKRPHLQPVSDSR